jgi:hypothetical protein
MRRADTEDDHTLALIKIIKAHPLLPTDEVRFRLMEIAQFHWDHDNEEECPLVEVTPCVLIALLREVAAYRDEYGLIEATSEEWQFNAHQPPN